MYHARLYVALTNPNCTFVCVLKLCFLFNVMHEKIDLYLAAVVPLLSILFYGARCKSTQRVKLCRVIFCVSYLAN